MIFRALISFVLMAEIAHAQYVPPSDTCTREDPCEAADRSFTQNSLAVDQVQKKFHFMLPRTLTPDEITDAQLYDKNGELIRFRFLPEPGSQFIVGTPEDGLTFDLSKIIRKELSFRLVISGKNARGETVPLNENNVSVITKDLEDVCFDIEKIEQTDVEILVGIAVDRSASMGGVIGDVQASLKEFLERMPDKAICRVLPFNSDIAELTPFGVYPYADNINRSYACNALATNNIAAINPAGGTSISPALNVLYRRALNNPDALNLVVAISDGDGDKTDQRALRVTTLPLRDEAKEYQTYTFVNWLGNFDDSYALKEFADGEMVGRIEGRPFASDFFSAIEERLVGQHVITIPCQK